ncbi:uncharacterized protein [Penaeus vannamei]|uniref:uncharacterized protein isoform X6 n=1 Tax=Penaeus vannamei TaxID=6689 RepID=UPI00387F3D3D
MNENFDLDQGDEPGKDNAMIYEHQKNSRRRDSDSEDYPYSKQARNEETDRQSKEHRTQASVTHVIDISQMESKEEQYTWYQLSPRHLEHRVQLPTAITLYKLFPKQHSATSVSQVPSVHMYKHLSPEEIEKAQAMARNFLTQDRLTKSSQVSSTFERKVDNEDTKENKRNPTTKKANPIKLIKTDEGDVKVKNGKEKFTRLETKEQSQTKRPTFPIYKGIGEVGLRTRQLSRLAPQVLMTLTDLKSIQMQPAIKDFVTPHETEIKKKRWEEFLRSAGRTLFSLKREIFLLERSHAHGERNNSKNLRILATSTCTLHKLLLHEYRPESIPRNEKNENEMTINLLQDNQESTKNKISETHKQLKYVHTRKVTIASGPRTMLARRPRHVGKPKKHSVKNQVQEKLVESESKKLPRNTQSRLLPLQRDTEQLERLQHQLQLDEAVVEQENEVTVAPDSSTGIAASSSLTPLHRSTKDDAIMNQFLPLVGQESKKVEDGCAAPASRLDFTDPSVQKQTSQIQFLLDRVYIIEDDWEKLQETLSKISKQMRGTIRDSETNLQIAIEKARRLMDSVGTNHRLTNEAHASTEMILDCGFFLKKNLADDNPSSEQGSRSVMSNNSKSSYSEVNEVGISIEGLNVNEGQKLISIADQLRQQKEEFWESLIKRGFMKPQDVTVEGAEAAKEVIDKIMQSKAQLDSAVVAEASMPRKATMINTEPRVQEISKATFKVRASLTNAKRNQTLSKTQVCQEAQVSLLSSYSSSDGFADQSTNSSEKSDSTYSTSHQSSDQLESFPSYDGISNGE